MKRNYVPTTLDQYINESKSITLKRGYKGQSPVVVGANAPIRNQILAYVAEGVRVGASDLKKFIAGLNETNANPNAAANMWLRRNGKFFIAENKGGKTYFKLSSLGQRLVNSFGSSEQVSESEKAKLQEKKKYDFKDPKTGDPGIVDDEEEEIEEACGKTLESVDPGKKAKANLGGRLDPKLHNMLTKDQDKDDGELDGFEKEITEGKEGISSERKARIEAIIENIKARKKSALNEAEEEEKEEESEEKEEGSEDELSFDDLDLSGEEGEDGEKAEGEEEEDVDVDVDADVDVDVDDDSEEGEEEDGEDEKVEITEFILTVDDVDSALTELEELGVDAEKVVDPEGEPAEGEEESYKDDEISVDAEDWDKLKGWLEDKGVDVEEMFGGEIEVEDVEDEDLEGEEDLEDLDVELEDESDEDESGEEDLDLDMDLDIEGEEGAEELEMEEEEPEVEESLTGMEKHEDDTNNLIKGAKTVIIKYDR
jgi:hypothetical protein